MHVKTLKKRIVLLEGMFVTIYFSSIKGTHFEKHNVYFYGSCFFEIVILLFLIFSYSI
jgi:hypothetical protein